MRSILAAVLLGATIASPSLRADVFDRFQADFPQGSDLDTAAVLDHYFLGDLVERYDPFTVDNDLGPMAVHRFWGGPNSVILVHGYLEHSLAKYRMVRDLSEWGYTVYAIDLPGHGLSSGAPADVPSFDVYADVLDAVIEQARRETSGVIHYLGHSTGSSMMMEWLFRGGEFDGTIIFAAPLVRSTSWTLSKVSVTLFGWATPRVGRVLLKHSHDADHMRFIAEDDPWQAWSIPRGWVRAHHAWESDFLTQPVLEVPVHIIQGSGDRVVLWRYNIDAIRSRFPEGTDLVVEDARHNLLTEGSPYREEVIDRIFNLLGKR